MVDIHTIQDTLAAAFRVGRYAVPPEDVRQYSARHGQPRQEPPPTPPHPPHTYSVEQYSDCWDNRLK